MEVKTEFDCESEGCLVGYELQDKLKRRKQMSDGEQDRYCFVREPEHKDVMTEAEQTRAEKGEEKGERDEDGRNIEPEFTHTSEAGSAACTFGAEVTCHEAKALSARPTNPSPLASVGSSRSATFECGILSHDDLDSGGEDVDEKTEDEEDGSTYEWQFEILNYLPHHRAVALVLHLRSSEREKVKAANLAMQLQRTNSILERRLELAQESLWERCSDGPRAEGLEEEKKHKELSGLEEDGDCESADCTTDSEHHKGARNERRGWRQLKNLALVSLCFFIAKPLALTVNSLIKMEDVATSLDTTECDPHLIERLKDENEVMRSKLDNMMIDVESAIQRGQDTVCWKV